MHNKTIVVDDVALTGSYNFSHAAQANAENMLAIANPDLGAEIVAYTRAARRAVSGRQRTADRPKNGKHDRCPGRGSRPPARLGTRWRTNASSVVHRRGGRPGNAAIRGQRVAAAVSSSPLRLSVVMAPRFQPGRPARRARWRPQRFGVSNSAPGRLRDESIRTVRNALPAAAAQERRHLPAQHRHPPGRPAALDPGGRGGADAATAGSSSPPTATPRSTIRGPRISTPVGTLAEHRLVRAAAEQQRPGRARRASAGSASASSTAPAPSSPSPPSELREADAAGRRSAGADAATSRTWPPSTPRPAASSPPKCWTWSSGRPTPATWPTCSPPSS